MQVNENVNVSNFLAVGNQTGKGSRTKVDKSEQTDFASFLMPSVDSSNNIPAGTKQQPDVKKVSDGEALNEKSPEKNVAASNEEDIQKADLKEAKESSQDDTVTSEHTDDVQEPEYVDENGQELSKEEMEAFLEAAGHILQQVMEWFGLTAIELNEKLDELGMELSDLLSDNGLKTFFLSEKSAEVSDLIVNEDLNQEWNQFFDGVMEEMHQEGIRLDDVSAYVKETNVENLLDYVFKTDFTMPEDFVKKEGNNQPEIMEIPTDSSEPTVAVLDEGTLQNEENALDSQTNENQDTYTSKETAHVKENAILDKKEPHFENPVLHAVEQAVDNLQDISFTEEIPVSGKEVIDQIVELIKVKMNQDTTSLEMQLYPEHLGKIQIHVVSKDGVMTARIVAETEAAKQAIEGGITSLKESMEQQNLKVDAIEVMVSTTGFESGDKEQDSYKQQQSAKPGKKLDLSELQEDEAVKEAAELEKMKYTGSSVSYTA